MTRRRSIAGSWLFALWLALCLLITMPPFSLAVLILPAGPAVDRIVRRWCRLIVRLSGCQVMLSGVEHLGAGSMLVANHASYVDSVVLMAALPIDMRFVAHQEALAWPMIGRAMRKAGHIIIDRASARSRRACFLAMKATLEQGRAVFVFPEGRRGGDALLPFRPGAFRAAAETGRPIVPIAIAGTREILPRSFRMPRRGPIVIRVQPPRAAGDSSREATARLRLDVEQAIAMAIRA